MRSYDIAIIGAGAAGLSAACFLSKEATVVVIERESQPAYHSSGRSAAVYAEGYENAVVATLTRASRGFFFEPDVGFCDHPLVRPMGSLTTAGADEIAAFERHLADWQPANPDLRQISIDEAVQRVPILNPVTLVRVCYDPTTQAIDVHELLQGYRRTMQRNGADLLLSSEVTALSRNSRSWTIDTRNAMGDNGETLHADILVNAAGAWAEPIAALAGLPAVGLTPMRRTALLCAAPQGAARWPMVHTTSNDLYFKPEGGALMVSPADEHASPPCDAQPEEIDVAIAIDRLQLLTTLAVQRIEQRWAGLRTFAPDRAPVFGFDPLAADFFWLAGQGGFGVQTSPGLGRFAADAILGRDSMVRELSGRVQVSRFR